MKSLKTELREEREYLNGIAQALEAYLLLCYEEVGDYDLVLKFTKFPKIISMIKGNEMMKSIASKIFVYSEILRHRDHEISFDVDKEIFTVRVIHHDYPF